MTNEEAVAELKEIIEEFDGDPEAAHINADQVLCDLLEELGYDDVVKAWHLVPRFYS